MILIILILEEVVPLETQLKQIPHIVPIHGYKDLFTGAVHFWLNIHTLYRTRLEKSR